MEIEENRFSEYTDKLSDNELVRLGAIVHTQKKLEYAASRYLKHHLFGASEIYYDSTGAPMLDAANYVSLSHSRTHVCLGVCKEFPIGIDIEIVRDTSVKVAHRYVAHEEKTLFNIDDPEDMTLLWSLKETMYKLSDRNKLLFQEHLRVDSRHENKFQARVLHTAGFKEYTLQSFHFDTFYLTCNTSEGTYI